MYKLTDELFLDIEERQYVIREFSGKRKVWNKETNIEEEVDVYNPLRYYGALKSLRGYLETLRRMLLSKKCEKSTIKSIDSLIESMKESDSKINKLTKAVEDGLCKFEVNRIVAEKDDEIKELEERIISLKKQMNNKQNKKENE